MLVLFIAGHASAQQAVIERCKQTSSDTDRIACLEAALLGKETAVAPPSSESPTAVVEVPELSPAAEAAAGIGAEQVIARNQTRDEMIENLEKAEGLAVTSYETVPYERLQVTLENGQVWRQIVGDTQTIRASLSRNTTVDIEESSLGGYKLRLNEMRRTIRVERIR